MGLSRPKLSKSFKLDGSQVNRGFDIKDDGTRRFEKVESA